MSQTQLRATVKRPGLQNVGEKVEHVTAECLPAGAGQLMGTLHMPGSAPRFDGFCLSS